jgi:hypothetical protein
MQAPVHTKGAWTEADPAGDGRNGDGRGGGYEVVGSASRWRVRNDRSAPLAARMMAAS